MKTYKVGFFDGTRAFEDLLNSFAKDGWELFQVLQLQNGPQNVCIFQKEDFSNIKPGTIAYVSDTTPKVKKK